MIDLFLGIIMVLCGCLSVLVGIAVGNLLDMLSAAAMIIAGGTIIYRYLQNEKGVEWRTSDLLLGSSMTLLGMTSLAKSFATPSFSMVLGPILVIFGVLRLAAASRARMKPSNPAPPPV